MVTNNAAPPPSDFGDTDLMNYVVRMVIPMRREFARSLDVTHFLHDFSYAREILDQASDSTDARLRDYAAYLNGKMFGPRNASPHSPVDAAKSTLAASAPAVPVGVAGTRIDVFEDDMRARVMSKYKRGLR